MLVVGPVFVAKYRAIGMAAAISLPCTRGVQSYIRVRLVKGAGCLFKVIKWSISSNLHRYVPQGDEG